MARSAVCCHCWLKKKKKKLYFESFFFLLSSRVCGRKRKGTPVKVCDRAYVTEDEEEESMSEHSYSPGTQHFFRDTIFILLRFEVPPFIFQTLFMDSFHCVPGDSQYPEGAEDRLPPAGSPYYLPDPSQLW